MASRRWLVAVTDHTQQRAYFGPYRSLERAEGLQSQINKRITARVDETGTIAAWASVEELEPSPGCKAIIEWALGYPE